MQSDIDLKKLLWHSRRGMLELDLILLPFVQEVVKGLSKKEVNLYRLLLEEEDQDLYKWLIGKEQPEAEGLQQIISMIRENKAS